MAAEHFKYLNFMLLQGLSDQIIKDKGNGWGKSTGGAAKVSECCYAGVAMRWFSKKGESSTNKLMSLKCVLSFSSSALGLRFL